MKSALTDKPIPPEIQAEIDVLERDIEALRKDMQKSFAETNSRLDKIESDITHGAEEVEKEARLAEPHLTKAEREAANELDALMLEEAEYLAEEA